MRCNILPVKALLDQHLIAEKRELRMIPPLLEKRVKSGKDLCAGSPAQYTLGSGHMLFWLNKMNYLYNRFDSLAKEMQDRGFKVDPHLTFDMNYAKLYKMDGDWEPQLGDYSIIVARLKEKIAMRPGWYRYRGLPISQSWANSMYNQYE